MTDSSFAYIVRESPRAKNVRLKVTPQRGLEVFVPAGYDRKRIPDLLKRKKAWVTTALEKAESLRKFFEPQPAWELPTGIHLLAIGRTFHVEAQAADLPWAEVRIAEDHIVLIRGRIDDEAACRAALSRWLSRLTHEYMVDRLMTLSSKTGLKYHRVMVKQQKTRWASCSRHKTISLNVKLLLLPAALVDYVLIHELCHLKEMNHSKRFWILVEKHCPNYRALDAQLRDMWKVLPRWLMDDYKSNGFNGAVNDL